MKSNEDWQKLVEKLVNDHTVAANGAPNTGLQITFQTEETVEVDPIIQLPIEELVDIFQPYEAWPSKVSEEVNYNPIHRFCDAIALTLVDMDDVAPLLSEEGYDVLCEAFITIQNAAANTLESGDAVQIPLSTLDQVKTHKELIYYAAKEHAEVAGIDWYKSLENIAANTYHTLQNTENAHAYYFGKKNDNSWKDEELFSTTKSGKLFAVSKNLNAFINTYNPDNINDSDYHLNADGVIVPERTTTQSPHPR